MGSRYIVGLDIGTASTKVALAENQGGRPIIRALFKEQSAGLRKGAVVDLADASSAVTRALHEVKKVARAAAKSVYVNIGTHQIKSQASRGIVAVSRADSEIYQDDIDRAVKASQAVNLHPNRMLIHTVTREYIVDGVGDITDPLGLSGNRLEVNSLIIDAFAPHVKSLIRLVELGGGQVGGLVLDPLISSRSALSRTQKDLGVLLVDMGAGTTSIVAYEEHKLLGVSVFPVGAANITNDLAVGLKVPVAAAEQLKLHYGYALARDVGAKEAIDLSKFGEGERGVVSRRFIAEVIESRLAEIFEFINNEVRLWGKLGQLAGGAVLVGGGAKLPGLTDLAKQELKLSAQIGFAGSGEFVEENASFSELLEDPEYVNALGLVLWGMEKEGWQPKQGIMLAGAKQFFKRYFLP